VGTLLRLFGINDRLTLPSTSACSSGRFLDNAIDCFHPGVTMSEVTDIAGARLRSFVERIEHVEEEIQGLNEGKKEIFDEAKGEGFDVKIIKEIIKIRKQDKKERDEHETLLDVYMRAIETAGPLLEAAE
jgi:uncharacterized protein (UPF0335 family)